MQSIFAILCLVTLANSHNLAQEQPRSAGISCSREGLLCKDCMTLIYCKRTDKSFQEIPLSTCTNQAPCDDVKKSCALGGTCRYKSFRCPHYAKGRYPDPYSCLQYHDCSGGGNTVHSCAFPSAYDVTSESCSNTVDDNYCTSGPVNVCQENGEVFPIPGHSYRFECLKEVGDYYDTIYPQLEVSTHGK